MTAEGLGTGGASTGSRRANGPGYWLGLTILPLVFLAGCWLIDPEVRLPDTSRFSSARLSFGDRPGSSPGDCQGEPVALPHRVDRSVSGPHPAAFCFEFAADQVATESTAVLIPRAFGILTLEVNGHFLGQSRPTFETPAFERNPPLWFDVPGALLHPGRNVLTIRTAPPEWFTGLFPVHVGAAAQLWPAYRMLRFLRVDLLDATLVAILVIGLAMAGVWLLRPRESVYGWFAAAMGMWALHIAMDFAPHPILLHALAWEGLDSLALGWFVCLAAVFVNRVTRSDSTSYRSERLILAFAVMGAVLRLSALFQPRAGHWVHLYFWVPGMLVIGAMIVSRLVRDGREQVESRLLSIAASVLFAAGVRDYIADFTATSRLGTLGVLPYTVNLVLIVYGSFLLRRFTGALDALEDLNRQLDARIDAKTRELADFHARMLQVEKQRALQDERERLARDMHDGLGGQLVQALALAECSSAGDEIKDALRCALSELRVLIEASDPANADLSAVLATMHEHGRRRAGHAGLRLDWAVGDPCAPALLGPTEILQLFRIFDEALTNAIRHARASRFSVHGGDDPGDGRSTASRVLHLEFSDDGCGIPEGVRQAPGTRPDGSRARGLVNMHARARAVGAELVLRSGPGGTTIAVCLPLPERQAAV